jgi:hypothetical protein
LQDSIKVSPVPKVSCAAPMKSCTVFLPPALPTNFLLLNTEVILFLNRNKRMIKRNKKGIFEVMTTK